MQQKIGKYEILEQIGAGGFGTVFKAFDPFLKRTVAIKACTSRDETVRLRFYREAEIAGNLKHPCITTIHDFGFHEDTPFLVEEYLEGQDLDKLLKGSRQEGSDPLTLERELDFLIQIASGLEHAHGEGVIHRDIKPGNIRILARDEIKIMDFGTAKKASSDTQLTEMGFTVGTASYLSPEQIRGDDLKPNSDIFSFGILAYEMAAGQRPFQGRSIPQMIDQILHHEPSPLAEIWTACPPDLAEIIHRCLEKERANRYGTFSEVGRDFRLLVRRRFAVEPHEPPFPRGARIAKEPAGDRKPSLVDRARELIHDEEMELALLALRTALRRDPLAPNGASLLLQVEKDLKAAAQAEGGRPPKAADVPTRPLPVPPPRERELAALLARAETLYREKKLGETQSILQQAIRLDPHHSGARELLLKTRQENLAREKERRHNESIAEARQLISRLCRKGDLKQASEALSFAVRRLGNDQRLSPEGRRLARAAVARRGKLEDRREGLLTQGLALAQVLLDARDFASGSRLLSALRPLDQHPAVIAPRLKEMEKARSKHAGRKDRRLQAEDAVATVRALLKQDSWHEAVDAMAFAQEMFGDVPELQEIRQELVTGLGRSVAELSSTSHSLAREALAILASLPQQKQLSLRPRLETWIGILDPSAVIPEPVAAPSQKDDAKDSLLQVARDLARTGNRSAARSAVRALLAVDAGHAEGNALLKELKSRR